MPSQPHEADRALPPPSGRPLPVDLAPPSLPDLTVAPGPSPWATEEPDPSSVDAAAPTEPAQGARPDALVPTGSVGVRAAAMRRRGPLGFWFRQPRWAKIAGAAAVVFAVAATVSVAKRDPQPVASRAAATSASPTIARDATSVVVLPTSIAATTVVPATTAQATTTPAITAAATTSPATTAPATTAPPTTAAPPAPPAATDVLATIGVAAERTAGYTTNLFPTDPAVSAQGCDVQQQVLKRDSRAPVQLEPGSDCAVAAGEWFSALDGLTTGDPATLTLSRTVSLREAWKSGAWSWTTGQRAAFAGDLTDARTARVVTVAVARTKADRDPTSWLPDGGARCSYVADWLAVKARWGLSMDSAEAGRLGVVVRDECPGLTVAPWAAPPPAPDVGPDPVPTTVPYYLDCADAKRRGVTSIPRGAPGYRPALDGNGNGIACE